MTIKRDITWQQGALLSVFLPTTADLTGRTLTCIVRRELASDDVLLALADDGPPEQLIEAVEGGIQITLGAEAGAGVATGGKPAGWVYAVKAALDSDPEDTLRTHEGVWIVSPDPARTGEQTPADPAGDLRWLRPSQIVAGTNVTITQSGTGAGLTLTFSAIGGGGASAWGSITGTLSAQTDLQSALDGKVGTGDSRLTDARTADAIRETSGPTLLTVGAIADGEPAARVGTTFVGMTGALWDAVLTKLTLRRTNAGTANTPPTSGIALENTEPATASQNQFSPTLLFRGQGWKITVPESQDTQFRAWLQQRTRPQHAIPQLVFAPTIGGTEVNGIAFSASLSGGVNNAGTYITGLDGTGNYGPDNSAGFAGLGPVNAANAFGAWNNASVTVSFVIGAFGMSNGAFLGWASAVATTSAFFDVQLHRVAADTLSLRRSTNAQAFRVYNTWTDASNGEWLNIGWSGNVCTVEPTANGTGAVRPLVVRHPPVTLATLPSAATAGAGARSAISDSSVTMSGNFGAVAAGGGANMVPVISDGTDWRIG